MYDLVRKDWALAVKVPLIFKNQGLDSEMLDILLYQ